MESAAAPAVPTAPPAISAGPAHWLRWTLFLWLATCAVLIAWRWGAIHWFALADTDDNLRFAQVRALLAGQGWFDLRQYRLDPPGGANIHWSRLVDLPIAGIILLLKPFAGTILAQKIAVGIAPLLPLGAAIVALALAVRRLVAPAAFAFAVAMLLVGNNAMQMFMPTRIDHHGWQLACLAALIAGGADPDRRRGGLTVGLATALSLTIGLEILPYLAIAGAVIGLRWIVDRAEAPRLVAYGATLAGGTALGYLLFASYANRAPVCDALSPVWLSAMLAAGALLVAVAPLRIARWPARLALMALVGAILATGFALAWPHCLGRLEGVSPELDRIWLSNVREAKPLSAQGWRGALQILALPLAGLVGYALALWRNDTAPRIAWATPALVTVAACAMLTWQTRTGPAAQLAAVPGAAYLAWAILPGLARDRRFAVKAVGTAIGFLLVSGVAIALLVQAFPEKPATKSRTAIARANRLCPTLPALRPIAKLPAATILTFVDFGPRLIATTRHRAIAGPYHRNGAAILDVQHAFRGSPAMALDVMRRHGATLLLICPGMSESTIYATQAKRGFYAQLMRGRVPSWLVRVKLPRSSPFRLYRLVAARPAPQKL